MDYQEIAFQVNQFVKNPQNFLSARNESKLPEMNERDV